MADPVAAAGPDKGPYTSTETKVYKIQPIEVALATQYDASRAPPPLDPDNKDPYTSTETKTLKIVNPIELTLTTTVNSSHVPPPPAARDEDADDGNRLMDMLQPLAQMIIARLDEIRRAQQTPPSPS